MTGVLTAVPVARSPAGALVRPHEAEPGVEYVCPGCGAPVTLRRGDRRRAHFAHRRGESCSAESALHRAAKRELVRVVTEWVAGSGPCPALARSCPRIGCGGGVVQNLPADVTRAREEVRLGGGAVADVVLFRGEAPAVAIEVLVTSKVGREKAARIALPWVELRADEVLERPYWWVARQDGLLPFECPACARRRDERARAREGARRRAGEVAERIHVELPPSPPYGSASHRCWRCGAEMVVHAWPGSGRHARRRPPEPVPPTVRHRVTEGAGDYWANCCPSCSAVQGDYHLSARNADYRLVREVVEDAGPGAE